jgi:hypothetical protein
MPDATYTPNAEATTAAGDRTVTIAAGSGATTIDPRRVPTHMPAFVPSDELFFWTRAWQEGERESAAEREAGNLRTFENPRDLLSWLLRPED